MNRGDTAYLLLNYTINGEPLIEGAYQEIELTIKSSHSSVRKTLSDGDIKWVTLSYEVEEEGQMITESFTGYVCHLEQKDTFKVDDSTNAIQLRIMLNDEVGSSAVSEIEFGEVLSNKVLINDTD